jgi:hypothetical protein
MKKIIVIDAETDPFLYGRIPQPFIWGVYDGENYLEFNTTADMVKYIRDQRAIVYAHNGGRFDFHYLVNYLECFTELLIINGRIAKFVLGKAELRDSYCILPIPLSAYKKDDIDYRIFEPQERIKAENKKKISSYLFADCKYTHELILDFIKKYGSSITLASAAMKTWAGISKREIPHSSKQFYNDISPYYYGGRCEVFKAGLIPRGKTLKCYDINSAYPYAMRQSLPWGFEYNYRLLGGSNNINVDVKGSGFYQVKCVSKGAFPQRDKDGSLFFPTDNVQREYLVTGWELQAAVETGTIKKFTIMSEILFNDNISFIDYVDKFYKLKSDSQPGSTDYIFAKLFLNSLYGKFGANPANYQKYMIQDERFISAAIQSEHDKWEYNGSLGQWALMQAPLPEDEQIYFNVAVAASITGYVRAFLWRSICQSNKVYYCDTDSIICENSNIQISKCLGDWKLEGEFVEGGIAGKKLYALKDTTGHWKTASKGAKLTPAEIIRVARGETIEYIPENPTFSVSRGPSFIKREIKRTA